MISSGPPPRAIIPVGAGRTTDDAPPASRRGAARRGDGSRQFPRWLRVVAWLVAIPTSLVVVGIPARLAGYLTGQRLGDVVLKNNLGRFVPLLVIVVLAALVCTVLVTVIVEGGGRFLARRAASRD